MKKVLIILILISCKATQQQTFTTSAARSLTSGSDSVKWFTGNESAVKQYLVEYGKDTFHFSTIGIIQPGKNVYSFPIPDSSGFIRIHASGFADFFTPPKLHRTVTNYVTITNALYASTSLKWTVSNEKNVSSYLIEKSSDGKNWSKTTSIPDKGNGTYTYRYSRTIRQYIYRISPVFNDGTKGTATSFK